MHRLADVEVAMVMHHLPVSQLLQLARCSRALMHAADCSFAFAHSTLRVSTLSAQPPRFAVSGLLRHACFSLLWTSDAESMTDSDLRLLLDLMTHCSDRLRAISVVHEIAIEPHLWHRVLAHPAAMHLRSLSLYSTRFGPVQFEVDGEMIARISQLPLLHTLRICPMPVGSSVWLPLADCAALTDLSISDHNSYGFHSCLPLVAQCLHLRRLALHQVCLHSPDAVPFFTAMAPRLVELTLDDIAVLKPSHLRQPRPIPFALFTQLERLCLRRCVGVEHLMRGLLDIPSLRCLRIEAEGNPIKSTHLPSGGSLSAALERSPRLCCVVRVAVMFLPLIEDSVVVPLTPFGRRFTLSPGAN